MHLIPHDRRSLAALTHDVAAAVLAWALAYWLRFNLDIPDFYVHYMWRYLGWVIPLQTGCFLAFGLYRGIWRYASLPDLKQILFAALSAMACVLAAVVLLGIPHIPRAALLMYPLILVMIMGGSRFAYRMWREHRLYSLARAMGEPVLVAGAAAVVATAPPPQPARNNRQGGQRQQQHQPQHRLRRPNRE